METTSQGSDSTQSKEGANMGIQIYETLKDMTRRYNLTNQPTEEITNQLYMEFIAGDYGRVLEEQPNKEAFFRAFVKKRCKRELTKQSRYRAKHGELFDVHSTRETPELLVLGRERSRMARELACKLISGLSARERVVVKMLIAGANYREISDEIGHSLGTVHNIIARLQKQPEVQELRTLLAE